MKCTNCSKTITTSVKFCKFCKKQLCSYSCLEIHLNTKHKSDFYKKNNSKKKLNFNKNIINSPFLVTGKINKNIEYDPLYAVDNFSPIFENGEIKHIGGGSFGQVFLVINNINKKQYAIKHMQKEKLINILQTLDTIYKEIEFQSIIDHPNIVKLLNAEEDEENFDLVMDYAKNGNLFHYIRKNKGLNEDIAFNFFIQIVNAINFLHSNDLIHRDIKPENILMFENNHIKLCDFGWCVKLDGQERETYCGTTEYMSPELVNHRGYSKEIDVWSLGILLYEMIHGYSPFRPNKPKFNEKDVVNNIKAQKVKFAKKVSFECKELILHLLDFNKNRRYKVQDIYKSNFVKKYAEAKLNIIIYDNNELKISKSSKKLFEKKTTSCGKNQNKIASYKNTENSTYNTIKLCKSETKKNKIRKNRNEVHSNAISKFESTDYKNKIYPYIKDGMKNKISLYNKNMFKTEVNSITSINLVSESNINIDEICNYDYYSNSNENIKKNDMKRDNNKYINKFKSNSNYNIIIPRLPFHTERNLENNQLSDYTNKKIKKTGSTKIYCNKILGKTQKPKKNIQISYYTSIAKKVKQNQQGLSSKGIKIKKYFSYNNINKIYNTSKNFNNTNDIVITQKSTSNLKLKKQNAKSNLKPKIKKSPISHIHAFTSHYIYSPSNETKKLTQKNTSSNKQPSNFDSITNKNSEKKINKYNIKTKFIATSRDKKIHIKNTMNKFNTSKKRKLSENNMKKSPSPSISFKNKILCNNSDIGYYALKKIKSHLYLNKNLDSEFKIKNLKMTPKNQIKSNNNIIVPNKMNSQFFKTKTNKSLKGRNYILNEKRIIEKRVVRDKNNILFKRMSPLNSERNNINNYKTQTDYNKFCINSRNINTNIKQIASQKNKIAYSRINKINNINYQNNNINNFYIIQDNNSLKKLPNSDCKQNILSSNKYNMIFSNNNYTIELNKMKSLENKMKRGYKGKYMITNKYRNHSYNDSKDKSKIKRKLINLKDNEIKSNNNIKQIKNNNINLRELKNLSKNAKSKSKDSDSGIIDDDSEFTEYEHEVNITPKKKNDHMRINPVKLLGDFKKEFNRYSKNDKKDKKVYDY